MSRRWSIALYSSGCLRSQLTRTGVSTSLRRLFAPPHDPIRTIRVQRPNSKSTHLHSASARRAPEDRLSLVVKMHAQSFSVGQIRLALGWSGESNNGYGMVKRLMIEAGLR